jgi:hypothetical protein
MHASLEASHAVLPVNAQCTECHDKDLANIHAEASVETSDTTRTSCAVCHADGVPASADCNLCHSATPHAVSSAFCLTCHTGAKGTYPGGSVVSTSTHMVVTTSTVVAAQYPGTSFGPATCLNCHAGHAGTRAEGNQLCYDCHDATGTSKPEGYSYLGTSAFKDSGHGAAKCMVCHTVHGPPVASTFYAPSESTLASDQADGTYAAPCFACHGGVLPSGATTMPVDVKQFTTAGNATAGHRIVTPGGNLPVGAPLPCQDCHNPHGSERGNGSMLSGALGASLDTSTSTGVRRTCFSCHATADSGQGWDSIAEAYAAVGTATVEGIPRSGGVLKLPPFTGHNVADASSCYACHGKSYAIGGNNVHNPEVAEADVASHTSDGAVAFLDLGLDDADHAVSSGPYLVEAQCLLCHVSNIVTLHTGGCLTCHASSDPNVAVAISGGNTACTACHSDGSYHQSSVASHEAVRDAGACDCHGLGSVDGNDGHGVTANNCGACHRFPGVVDATAPITTSDAQAAYVGPATVRLSATDQPFIGGSHVAHTYYRLDGGDQTEGSAIDVAPPVSGSASHQIEFWSVDGAGNAESVHGTADFDVAQDGTPPATTSDVRSHYWAGPDYGDPPYWAFVWIGPDGGPFTAQQAPLPLIGLRINFAATDDDSQHAPTTQYSLDGSTPTTGSSAFIPMSAVGPEHSLSYHSTDFSGNVETAHDATFTISLDATAPVTTFEPSASYATRQQIPISMSDDGGSGVKWLWFNSSIMPATTAYIWSDAYGVGTHTIQFQAVDNVGNTEPVQSVTWTYGMADIAPPTTTSDALPSYTGTATITLSASDGFGGSGVNATYWRDGSTGIWQTGTSVVIAPPAVGSASHTLYFWSTDAAGNTESHKSATITVDAIPDSTPPSTTSDFVPAAGALYAAAQPVELTALDEPGGSGVKATYYSLDGAPNSLGTTFTVAGDGLHTFSYYSEDNAGNAETPTVSSQFRIDTVAPETVSNVSAGHEYFGDQAFTLTATDAGSGVSDTLWQLDSVNGPWVSGTSVDVSAPATGTESHVLYWHSRDNATNVESVMGVTFSMTVAPPDATPPTTASSFNPLSGTAYPADQAVVLTPADNAQGWGVESTYYSIDGGPYSTGTTFTVSGDGLHTFSYYSVDKAGNSETAHASAEFLIDTVAPQTASTVVAGTTYTGAQTFFLSPTDAGAGVTDTLWQLDSTSGPWTSGTFVTVSAPATGTVAHTLYWYSHDYATNSEAVNSAMFSVSAPGAGTSESFGFTGADQTFVVPAGVTSINVTLYGAAGGASTAFGVDGAYGGRVVAAVPVSPGETLTVRVGGRGEAGENFRPEGIGGHGGWPNGGDGVSKGMGAGGGSSSILSSLTVLVEAGAGGGADDDFAQTGTPRIAAQDPTQDPHAGIGALDGGYQGWLPGGNQSGAGLGGGGGGGGWNGGLGDASTATGGGGGSSYIAFGTGTLSPGVSYGDGSVTIEW